MPDHGSTKASVKGTPYDAPPPSILYKFRDLPAVGAKEEAWRRSELVFGQLYFARPSELNDPFDCRPYFVRTATSVDLFLHSAKNKWRIKPLRGRRRRTLVGAVGKRVRDPEFHAAAWRKSIDRYGVYCLSEIVDHPLMWGHYSRGHRGYCLEFSIPSECWTDSLLPVRVTYSEARTGLGTSVLIQHGRKGRPPRLFAATVHHKDKSWEYERERRMIRLPAAGGPGLCHAPPTIITGVILGACISTKDEERLMSWVQARKARTRIRRAQLRPHDYGLDFVEEGVT